ncbi:hypothetical protein B0A50_03191 [Salinomyces thailandicus]|uniref:Uncharacterized protein n=1 Tax=Salinomyces thailandicus TaxID=706561 RepID=A0A4U0U4N4_9PEZI|nr:hypothetical protein B0A50_03191 [Salinomyces thailandica]
MEEQHVEPDHAMAGATGGLQFDEPLTWKAGKPIAVSELLRRLKALAEELQNIDQGDADREALVPRAQELASAQLLAHKDKGVKAWSMLCIVEMFRLLAPDAPYKGGQLKQVFDIFVSTIVPALASPTDPYNQQHSGVLQSLTGIKSIVLLTDIPGSDRLIWQLFMNCFDVMSGNVRGGNGEQLPKNVEYHMTQMLCTLVDECGSLPDGVVDLILAQFLRADPASLAQGKKGELLAPLTMREVTPAYNMARSICNSCADKMSRAVSQYFSAVLIDASEAVTNNKQAKRGRKRNHDESEDESDDGLLTPPAETDFQEVEKAHRLLRELWRSAPDVIQNIVPQMEAEVAAESPQLRTMAVQTVGDMIAGIGAAGPPLVSALDPTAYPSQSLEPSTSPSSMSNPLLAPIAPHAFASIYPSAYQGFIDRHRDKAAAVRSAWATASGLIIWTSGGGKGLDTDQESQLLRHLSDMIVDQDERVRLAAVQAVARFDFEGIVQKLGKSGGTSTPGSILCNLADRIKDPKHNVRANAMELLARIWGVAAGAIAEGSERVRELLGGVPTRIFSAVYVNDAEINALVQKVTHESLLPISYPPIKPKSAANGDSQRVRDSQLHVDAEHADPDTIRAERILVLVRDLEQKAREVFFKLQQQQTARAKYLEVFFDTANVLHDAEKNVNDDKDADKKGLKKKLDTLAKALSRILPDEAVAVGHLKKFAAHNDRRSYQLIKFCYSPDSDYRKIVKAIKELTKRMEDVKDKDSKDKDAKVQTPVILDTLLPVVRAAAVLVYNRSHVPAIMHVAKTDEKGLGAAAHEVLKELSVAAPQVFKVHVHELCEGLKKRAPTAKGPNSPTAVDELKACAGFADRFSSDMPKDRDFYIAMTAFAKYGVPPEAAKHAVSVINTSATKREMYIKDIVEYCVNDFDYGAECFLSRLAALAQLRLVANKETEDHADAFLDIAARKVLGEARTMAQGDEPAWTEEIDDDLCAKLWALRILVNGLRGIEPASDKIQEAAEEVRGAATPVYRLLNTLIERDGELSKTTTTAEHHKSHLRLAAANLLLKLSCNRVMDQLLTPRDFNRLAKIAQDPLPEVRAGFVKTLKKYLGQGKLPSRFYGLVLVYAFEPKRETLESTTTWLKSRATKVNNGQMETAFSRFLSLLAHHQDFSPTSEDLQDFVEYILFYLKTVARQDNLPLVYHIAQRIKTVQDGIDPAKSENLYILSDLAEAVIRIFQDLHGWPLQLYSGKVSLPVGIFAKLPNNTMAHEIAERRYVPDELVESLEDLVKASMRPKKRKADGSSGPAAKKAKMGAERSKKKVKKGSVRKTPKTAKTPREKRPVDAVSSSVVRKSSRASGAKNYAESDSGEEEEAEDEQLDDWQSEDGEANKENLTSSTPPTSDPTPAESQPEITVEKTATRAARKQPPKAEAKKRQPPPRSAPQRSMRATRANKSKKEKDVLDVPSDSESELSDAPSETEA